MADPVALVSEEKNILSLEDQTVVMVDLVVILYLGPFQTLIH